MARVNHVDAVREAQMPPHEAERYAKRLGRRKYRVEGTGGGNSRFVYLATAERLRAKYGGKVVDYRPAQPSPLIAEARNLPRCSVCFAMAGMPCRVNGRMRKPHKARLAK